MAGLWLGRCSLLRPLGFEGRALACYTITGSLPQLGLHETRFDLPVEGPVWPPLQSSPGSAFRGPLLKSL